MQCCHWPVPSWVAGALKEASGLPFSCVLQPFSRLGEGQGQAAIGDTGVHSDAIARCSGCYA